MAGQADNGDGVPATGTAAAAGLSDAKLITASQSDPERFATIYDRHAPALYRYAVLRVGPDVAEDVVSETMLAAFHGRRRYDITRPDARPWLYGILTRKISQRRRVERTRYRALARLAPGDDQEPGPADVVAAAVTAEAVRGPLMNAVAALAKRDRDVLLLAVWADLSYQEIAYALGIPIGTVGSRLNRAKRRTRAAVPDIDIASHGRELE
jgi:RNA polymerase sigma factor (sigma-70 family)